MRETTRSHSPEFQLVAGGAMGERIRAHDWSATPLGRREDWPLVLCLTLNICLDSTFPTAIYWGPEMRLLYNDAWSPIPRDKHPWALGRAAQEVWADIWHIIEPQFNQVLETGQGFSTFDQLLPMERNGRVEETYWNYSFTPIRDEHNAIVGIFNQGSETTASVIVERERRAEVARLHEYFQHAPGAVALLRGPEHVFQMTNPAYQNLIGDRQVLGKPLREGLPEVISQGFVELLDQVYASGEAHTGHAIEVTLQRSADSAPEVRVLDFVFQPVRDMVGAVTGIFVQATDVTDREAAEEARQQALRREREANALLDALFASAPVGLLFVDRDLRFRRVNARLAEINGLPPEAHLGKRPDELLPGVQGLETILAGWRRVIDTGEPWLGVEVQGETPAAPGEVRIWEENFFPVRLGGEIVGLGSVVEEITARRRAEQALRDADRRKDDFLATLAHELRNPLAPIRNGLQLMKLSARGDARLERVSEIMERQMIHLVRLVDDLLDISRITRHKVQLRHERVLLNDVLARALESCRSLLEPHGHEPHGHELLVELHSEPLAVEGDSDRLTQVFSNLLSNAAKFTDPGGRISVRLWREGTDALVTVRDTGVGIAREDLGTIFEMFSQVHASESTHAGLGIGLALVRELVQRHGGSVHAHSAGRGHGSEFRVRLPLLPDVSEQPQAPPLLSSDTHVAPHRLRILIADDNEDAAATLAMLLRVEGHELAIAHDGLEALELAEKLEPQMILLDIGMPRLDGYTTARRLREQPWGRAACLVALTGWGQEEDKKRAAEAGFDEHFTKPVDPSELMGMVERCARSSEGQRH